VTSYADPPEAIASYGPLSDDAGRQFTLRWVGHGIAEVTELRPDGAVPDGAVKVTDRTAAERLGNRRLYVPRERLSAPGNEEFYLADLIGLLAVDAYGHGMGKVIAVHDHGAGASLEIGEAGSASIVVPFTRIAVPAVDIEAGRVVVVPPEVVDALADPVPAVPPHTGRR
jgi:16S rRNA processing protein RimM